MERPPMPLRFVLVGDGAVGKTCLAQHATNNFDQHSQFDTYYFVHTHKEKSHQLQLRDTAGQDDWDAQRAHSYMDVDAIFMCFSVISPPSFDHIKLKWAAEWRRYKPDAPVILIGTKKDMKSDPELLRRLAERGLAPITTIQGKQLAKEIGAVKYAEVNCTSAPELRELLQECIVVAIKKGKRDGCNVM